MSGRAAAALSVLLLGLLLLLAEYRMLQPLGLAPVTHATRGDAVPAAAALPPPPDLIEAHVETVLARPLFRPDRRPPALPATAAGRDAALPRLTGITIDASGRRAIFAGGARPVVVPEGGRVGVYLVQAIAPGQVTVYGPEGPRVLQPAFDTRPAALPSALSSPALSSGLPPPAPAQPGASILDLLLSRGAPGVGVPGLPAAPELPRTAPSMPQTARPSSPPPPLMQPPPSQETPQ